MLRKLRRRQKNGFLIKKRVTSISQVSDSSNKQPNLLLKKIINKRKKKRKARELKYERFHSNIDILDDKWFTNNNQNS